MSLIPASQIKVYADQSGYSSNDLSEEVLQYTAQELEYRLRELIQDASKYMHHCKRTKLCVEDLNSALRDKNQPLLYGYDPMDPLGFRQVPNTDLYYTPGEEVSLVDVLQEALPRAPLPPALTCHALIIEGVQPAIPENPVLQGDKVDMGPAAVAHAGPTRKELLEEAEVKPLVKHVLSRELLLYYDTLISDLVGFDSKPEASNAGLRSLEEDAGLQQLLPYLLQFISEGVPKHLKSSRHLMLYMKCTSALLKNPYLFVEPYLHQMMPPVLTCLVGKRLSEEPGAPSNALHWTVRQEAAGIVAVVCNVYGSTYASLVPRIAKTLVKAFQDSGKPLTTHYGALAGIAALGPHAIDSLLLPSVDPYLQVLDQGSEEGKMVYELLERCALEWMGAFKHLANDPQVQQKRAILLRWFPALQS